jgi:hypothetical protein
LISSVAKTKFENTAGGTGRSPVGSIYIGHNFCDPTD